jgi:hypothetical protein
MADTGRLLETFRARFVKDSVSVILKKCFSLPLIESVLMI